MLTVARTLSVLSAALTVLLAVTAIGAGRLHLLQLAFEATGVLGRVSFTPAVLVALIALVLAVVRVRLGRREELAQVVLISAFSMLVLGVVAAMM